MGIRRRTFGQVGAAVIGAVTALVGAGPALAFVPLPPGGQVNDDLAAGINRALSVNGQNPTNADVVGGALTAGKVAVPWAIFRQTEASGSKDQVFSRSFAQGAWTTRGSGTVGGRSSASPAFPASLNFDQLQDGEAPAIDFAGAGRTVPWATWYENTTGAGFATNNVFASRFDNTGDANQGKWIFAGQNRGTGGTNLVPVPSLNIHTNQSAENPSVAGGSAADPTKPAPWVTWQETGANAPGATKNQIFVEKPLGPGQSNCDGVTPAAVDPSAAPRSAASAGSRSESSAWAPTPRSTSIARATASSPISPSPAPTTRSHGWSGMSRTPAPTACTTTRWCSPPRPSRRARRLRRPAPSTAGSTGSASAAPARACSTTRPTAASADRASATRPPARSTRTRMPTPRTRGSPPGR